MEGETRICSCLCTVKVNMVAGGGAVRSVSSGQGWDWPEELDPCGVHGNLGQETQTEGRDPLVWTCGLQCFVDWLGPESSMAMAAWAPRMDSRRCLRPDCSRKQAKLPGRLCCSRLRFPKDGVLNGRRHSLGLVWQSTAGLPLGVLEVMGFETRACHPPSLCSF